MKIKKLGMERAVLSWQHILLLSRGVGSTARQLMNKILPSVMAKIL